MFIWSAAAACSDVHVWKHEILLEHKFKVKYVCGLLMIPESVIVPKFSVMWLSMILMID